MKILTQRNIWGEHGYDRLLESFRNQNCEVVEIDLIPFTKHLDYNGECDIVLGSTRFIDLARQKGLPVFPTYDPIALNMFPKSMWLNGGGEWVKWKDLIVEQEPVFIKPKREKFFTGRVLESTEDKEKVQLTTSNVEDEGEELIWISPVKNVIDEYRFFVVGGNIITASCYRYNRYPQYHKIDSAHESWFYAQGLLERYKTDETFVLDIGYVKVFGNYCYYGIVELNNLNSAGIYACDTDVLARALIKYS